MDRNGHLFVDIDEGFACMGSAYSDPFASENEFPLREVFVSGFQMSKYATTFRQVYRFCEDTGYRIPAGWRADGEEINFPQRLLGREDYPANFISWEMASIYCEWLTALSGLNIVLPTEAEWEKAARGGDDRIWPWGNTFDPTLCNSIESGADDFSPVSAHEEGTSPFGCQQMAGGVWEWCLDFHHYHSHADLSNINPVNLRPSPRRVVKGGSAFCTKEIVRPACRDWTNSVNQGGGDDGFRIAVRPSFARIGA